MAQTGELEESDKEYLKYKLDVLREIGAAEERVLSLLSDYDITTSINNIEAVTEYMNNQGGWLKKLLKRFDDKRSSGEASASETELLNKADNLLESLTDSERMKSAYTEFTFDAKQMVQESTIDENNTFVDVKTMKLITSQITIASTMAREEMYQIPVMMAGEMTAINLRFRHNTGESQRVDISMQTEAYGIMYGEFSVKSQKVFGYMTVSSVKGAVFLQNSKELFAETLSKTTRFEMGNISIVQQFNISSKEIFNNDGGTQDAASSKDLYQVAKAFIETIRNS